MITRCFGRKCLQLSLSLRGSSSCAAGGALFVFVVCVYLLLRANGAPLFGGNSKLRGRRGAGGSHAPPTRWSGTEVCLCAAAASTCVRLRGGGDLWGRMDWICGARGPASGCKSPPHQNEISLMICASSNYPLLPAPRSPVFSYAG